MIEHINDISVITNFLKKFNQIPSENSNPFSKYLVYKVDNKIVSFMNYSLIYDRLEIEFLYTLEEYRNRSFATELINYIVGVGIGNKCSNITLEVRISNRPAICFYKKNGFKEVGIREKYYHDEDGILMLRELG